MLKLVTFELKKMLASRLALVANILMMALLVVTMLANIFQTRADTPQGEILDGLAAIEFKKAQANAFEGELTAERIAKDIAVYQQAAYQEISFEELSNMSNAAAYDLVRNTYDEEQLAILYDPYYTYILYPWRVSGMEPYQYAGNISTDDAMGFYDALQNKMQQRLDRGLNGMWPYSVAEQGYWTDKQSQIEKPLAYGYAGGWANVIDCYAFLLYAVLAICITLVPVFANEYRNGTDAVLLSSKNGTSKLVAAKLIAAFLYLTVYFALNAAILLGVLLMGHGTEGFSLPVQIYSMSAPYDLSIGQCALCVIGIMYVIALGFAGLTLGLSALTSSVLAIMVVDVMAIFVISAIPHMGLSVLFRIFMLFPSNMQNPGMLLAGLVSYPIGPVVLDLATMVLVVYALITLIGIPCATFAWKRHQVR